MSNANGYEEHASDFIALRDRSTVGVDVVRDWAQSLQPGAETIDIGCGSGVPVTSTLLEAGLRIWAVDASPAMVQTFRVRFPNIPVRCEVAEKSDFFGLKYDAAISIGLLFLLAERAQVCLLSRVAKILRPGGRFLFTAPIEVGAWKDVTTSLESRSLGKRRYKEALYKSGFRLLETRQDEGANNYYDAQKV
jgi:SAM-dependent methyltransferase